MRVGQIGCVVLLGTFVLTAGSTLRAQSGDWKARLQAQLEFVYKPTRVSTFEINNVTEAGTILVVKKDGIAADRAHAFGSQVTVVKDGQPKTGGGGLFAKSSSTTLDPGDKVYVLSIDVKDDNVQVSVLTLARHDVVEKGSTEHTRYKSVLRFDFAKGTLASASVPDVRHVIEDVLAP